METKMLDTLIITVWVCWLVLLPQSAGAEMRALTDRQMGDHFFESWHFDLTADLLAEKDMLTEATDLLEETEEERLNHHILEVIQGLSLEIPNDNEDNASNQDIYQDPAFWHDLFIDLYRQVQEAKSE
jgi:hypothetical protein